MMIEVLDPRGVAAAIQDGALGELPTEPRTIVLLDNSKANAHHLFNEIALGLRAQFPDATLVPGRKPSAGNPCPPEEFERLLECAPDLVVTGTAD
jgi:hypothetical protein